MKNKNFFWTMLFVVAGLLPNAALPVWGSVLTSNQRHAVADAVDFRLSFLGYGIFHDVEESAINPSNILGIPQRRLEMDLRPDFFVSLHRVDLEFKPRFSAHHNHWADGIFESRHGRGESEVYVNEWLARLRITDKVFVSGGRENLQWGPSNLLSPSNPFYRDNGRNNPSLELPGLDYARAVFIPSNAWTLSLIANMGKGRAENLFDFQNVYAVKLDFTGEEKYFSVIGSCRKKENPAAGFFGGMTIADPLLIYTEGSASAEEEAVDMLVGGAYTMMDGSVFSIEYFHHGSGCTKEPIEDCITSQGLYQELLDRFSDFSGDLDDLLDEIESLDLNFDSPSFIRKNYFLVQYSKARIRDTFSITLRWICNVDDVSGRTVGIGNYELNDHFQVFAVGNLYLGSADTEYGSLFNHSLMAGLTWSF